MIRRALPADADVLSTIAFAAKSHWGYPQQWLDYWKLQLTFTPQYFEEHESQVFEADDSLVGFYTLQGKENKAWIENMWVLPAYIGKGIGRQLFQHTVSASRSKGHLILQLEADPNAVGFYEKMGMKQIGSTHYEFLGIHRTLPLMEMTL